MTEVSTKTICPMCGDPAMQTKDSRRSGVPNVLRRRRLACTSCGAKFTTHEVVVADEYGLTPTSGMQAVEALKFEKAVIQAVEDLVSKHFEISQTLRNSMARMSGRTKA